MTARIEQHADLVNAATIDRRVTTSPHSHFVGTKTLRFHVANNPEAFGNMAVSTDVLHRAAKLGLIIENEDKRT